MFSQHLGRFCLVLAKCVMRVSAVCTCHVCDGAFTRGPEGLLKILIGLSPDKGSSGLSTADNKLPINTLWPVECELHEGFRNNS